jgi:pimeloyl-ACP methyl ester carboxylesterase
MAVPVFAPPVVLSRSNQILFFTLTVTLGSRSTQSTTLASLRPGGVFFYHQAGAVHYLQQHFDLTKARLVGASAGALTAALAGALGPGCIRLQGAGLRWAWMLVTPRGRRRVGYVNTHLTPARSHTNIQTQQTGCEVNMPLAAETALRMSMNVRNRT